MTFPQTCQQFERQSLQSSLANVHCRKSTACSWTSSWGPHPCFRATRRARWPPGSCPTLRRSAASPSRSGWTSGASLWVRPRRSMTCPCGSSIIPKHYSIPLTEAGQEGSPKRNWGIVDWLLISKKCLNKKLVNYRPTHGSKHNFHPAVINYSLLPRIDTKNLN